MSRVGLICAVLLCLGAMGCSGLASRGGPELTASEKERQAEIARLQAGIDKALWKEVEAQFWFEGGKTSDDHLRLLQVLATEYREDAAGFRKTMASYSQGISSDLNDFLAWAKPLWPPRSVLAEAWVRDGFTTEEKVLIEVGVNSQMKLQTFSQLFYSLTSLPWTRDGVTGGEMELIKAAFAASHKTRYAEQVFYPYARDAWLADGLDDIEARVLQASVKAARADWAGHVKPLLGLLQGSRFTISERIPLQSGEATIAVFARTEALAARMDQAMSLVKSLAGPIERFGGPYPANLVLVEVVDTLDHNACGTAAGSDLRYLDFPPILTLRTGCLAQRTVAHELTHAFVGTGPTWFAEGVADLGVLRVTGAQGSYYLSAPSSGLIKLNNRPDPGTPENTAQGGLGARFMVDAQAIIGPAAMTTAITEIARLDLRPGAQILDIMLNHATESQRPRLQALINSRFER